MNPVVEQIIGKLIIDPVFRQSFEADREKALALYRLTPAERSGLMQFDVQAIELAVRNLQMSRSIPMELVLVTGGERATRTERAGDAARERACRGVRAAKPLGRERRGAQASV